jgi:target of rapamycin complex subunit LST8
VNEETKTIPRFSALTKWQAHSAYITKVLLSPDGKCVWIAAARRSLIDMTMPGNRYLATCSADKGANLKIWSVSLGQQLEIRLDKVLQGHQRWVWDCAFSADSAYLVTGISSS